MGAEALMLPFPAREFVAGADKHGLRPYQTEAVAAGLEHIRHGSGRAVIATHTGSGKTRTAIALIDSWLEENPRDRCLWVTNRTVLIEDAKGRLASTLGALNVGREQAQWRADGERVVVGSLQSMKDERLLSMNADSFGLIVWDECQFWDSPAAAAILAHFTRAKVVGLSATPSTGEVIYSRDLSWGIDNGFAVPIIARYEQITELDISGIISTKNSAGVRDLQIGALEEAILLASAPIAECVWKHCRNRRPIIYTPGVASAHAIAKILNDFRPGWIESVDAKTPQKERLRIQKACEAGEIGGLTNCGIYLFGYDAPWCDAIVLGRLTEDWGTWMQQVGRGARPAAGIGELETPEQRISAIAASKKPNMMLLDLTGNFGKHSICSPTSLDRTLDKDTRARAEKKLRESPGMTVSDAIKEAKAWKRGEYDRLVALAVKVKIKSEGGTFDPFAAAGVKDRAAYSRFAPAWTREPPTEPQQWWLRKNGLPTDVSRGEASKMRAKADKWELEKRASYTQRAELSRLGLPHDLPWQTAADLLFACPEGWVNGKRQRTRPAPDVVGKILAAELAPKKKGRR